MKNLNRTLCAMFAFVVALTMGACNTDPGLDENKKVTFEISAVNPTAMGAELSIALQNVKEFAYVQRDTELQAVAILSGGTKVSIADPSVATTKKLTIQGLESDTHYTYFFAYRAADDTIIETVVKIEFTTTSYGDNVLTVVDQMYDGWSVFIQVPDEVKARNNALRYATSSMAMYNYSKMMGVMELDMLLYNAGQCTTTDKLVIYDEYNSTERDENGEIIYDENGNLVSAQFSDPKVPGEPGFLLVGEYAYMADEEERVVYVDGEVTTVNDGSYMENSIWWYPAGWQPGYYMPVYDWKSWVEAVMAGEEFDTEDFWSGYYERLYVETLKPEVIENGVEIKVTDRTPKDACISFTASEEVLQYCILVCTESEYETQILPLIENNPEHLCWFTGSYFSMMSFGIQMGTGYSELWVSDWFVDTNGMAGQTMRVLVAGLCDPEGKKQSFDTITFQLPEITLPKPEVVVTPVESNDPYTFTFNIKNPNGKANEITEAYFACNYTREFDAILKEYSYTTLLKEMGNALGDNEIAAINSEAGFNMTMTSRDNATSRLALLVYNGEGSCNDPDANDSTAVAEYTTPNANWPTRVNSDLFSKLAGEWVASAPMKNYIAETDAAGNTTGKYIYEDAGTYTSDVTIMDGLPYSETVPQEVYDIYTAAGISRDETEAYYEEFVELVKWYNNRTRGFNRLLCLGYDFADPQYLLDMVATPYDLFIDDEYSVSQVSYMFYDFGPKWNLEIDADGNVWLPLDIEREFPLEAFNFGLDYTFYMLGVGENSYIGNNIYDNTGKLLIDARFPVEVSADYNTITIKPIEYHYTDANNQPAVETYYPCVAQLSYMGATPVNPRVAGNVVLKRKGASTSAVKANASVAKGVSKTLTSVGEAPTPMARNTYSMTPIDPSKITLPTRLVREQKIEPGVEAYHKRATAAVKAYYGIK
ncbi:MAG: hypothetical protein J6V55_05555 [Alistipes sp.]|nr:hypothetical protein [Alistipes sp.]